MELLQALITMANPENEDEMVCEVCSGSDFIKDANVFACLQVYPGGSENADAGRWSVKPATAVSRGVLRHPQTKPQKPLS